MRVTFKIVKLFYPAFGFVFTVWPDQIFCWISAGKREINIRLWR
jgi:hypothetical protein